MIKSALNKQSNGLFFEGNVVTLSGLRVKFNGTII